ncbi:MAG: histidine phosphotransferase family protein [Pseudomonadota bacterium]
MRPDPDHNPDLAAVLSARICHDLVSPVGAIVNGVDLIRELGSTGLDDEFGMISQSATRASSLLQFYRLAFGLAAADAEAVARMTLLEQVGAMIGSARIEIGWEGADGPPLSRPNARLLCQILLCARALTGMTGQVHVALPATGAFPMAVSVLGDGAADAGERLALLTGEIASGQVTPRSVEFALARGTIEAMGLDLTIDRQPGRITIRLEGAHA